MGIGNIGSGAGPNALGAAGGVQDYQWSSIPASDLERLERLLDPVRKVRGETSALEAEIQKKKEEKLLLEPSAAFCHMFAIVPGSAIANGNFGKDRIPQLQKIVEEYNKSKGPNDRVTISWSVDANDRVKISLTPMDAANRPEFMRKMAAVRQSMIAQAQTLGTRIGELEAELSAKKTVLGGLQKTYLAALSQVGGLTADKIIERCQGGVAAMEDKIKAKLDQIEKNNAAIKAGNDLLSGLTSNKPTNDKDSRSMSVTMSREAYDKFIERGSINGLSVQYNGNNVTVSFSGKRDDYNNVIDGVRSRLEAMNTDTQTEMTKLKRDMDDKQTLQDTAFKMLEKFFEALKKAITNS